MKQYYVFRDCYDESWLIKASHEQVKLFNSFSYDLDYGEMKPVEVKDIKDVYRLMLSEIFGDGWDAGLIEEPELKETVERFIRSVES